MERVKGKLYDLEENLDNYLWYDKEELRKAASYEEGMNDGIEKGIEKVAINLLKEDNSIENVERLTGLSKDRIIELQKNCNG